MSNALRSKLNTLNTHVVQVILLKTFLSLKFKFLVSEEFYNHHQSACFETFSRLTVEKFDDIGEVHSVVQNDISVGRKKN